MRNQNLVAALLFTLAAPAARAQDAGVEFFERKIRPILVAHCYECHAATATKVRGGLLLDSRAGIRKGGVNGPVLVPGDPDKSPLIQAVRHQGGTKMPKNKLPAALIADLEAWVKMGAPDPRDKGPTPIVAKSWDEIVRVRRQWWSWQPVKRPSVPTPKQVDWSAGAIDRFLLQAMETKGLTPAKDADPRTLMRRLSLVLTGLPPTEVAVEEFAKAWDTASAKRGETLENLVDRLLASPHFGERWARHWMDVVRFTETHGNEWNYEVHHAWRYRDYLIRAFNDDVPYDQFVREHLAGDLLRDPRFSLPSPPRGRGAGGEGATRFNESIIGTAFYRFGEVNHDDCLGLPSIGYDLVDNQIDTLSKAFQATTIACARCHDHKLDAISTRDYHGLLGILRSSRQVAHTIDAPEVNAQIMRKMRDTKDAIREELANAWLKEFDLTRVIDALNNVKDDKLPFENPLALWRKVAGRLKPNDKATFAPAWNAVAAEYRKERAERRKHDAQFTTLADFRTHVWPEWQRDGLGLRDDPSKSGDFTIASDGRVVAALLPAGAYTHAISEKLNGVLRSPVLSSQHKFISFHVLGERASAVRLVSNNCQLNYANYRYLTKSEPHWITLPIPANADSVRVYAELMTKFDNPKFPDQLGTLGGDKLNYRIPWEQASKDPRSHFGVTHVVLHDQPAPPKATLAHLDGLIDGPQSIDASGFASYCSQRLEKAVLAWRKNNATDDDISWLDSFLRCGVLSNRAVATPKLEKLTAAYRKLDAELALPRIVPGLADFGPGFEQPIFARGDCLKPGDKAPRRYVEVLLPSPPGRGAGGDGSGRLELANLIASPDNPLTARVMVNRIWHHLFGMGLVRTVDDFGHVGELPSHPELLDYLASEFTANGVRKPPGTSNAPGGLRPPFAESWSIKKLIRAIVLTRAFRLAHTPDAAMLEADPENRLLARYPARRMEAEAIRDALLSTSGRLDRTLFGPSISAYREKEYADRRLFQGPLDGNGRRSIYIRVTLMEPPKFLEVFNFPGGKVCQGRRDVVNTPAQALALLNDPFVHGQAEVWAKRLLERTDDSIVGRLDAMFATALNRPPRADERERFQRFVTRIAELHDVPRDRVLSSPAIWRDVGHAIFNLQEFIAIP